VTLLPRPTVLEYIPFEILDVIGTILYSIDHVTKLDDQYRRSLTIDRGYASTKWSAFGDGERIAEILEVEGVILLSPYNHALATTKLADLAAAVNAAKKIRYGFFTRDVVTGISVAHTRIAAGFRVTMGFIPSSDSWKDAEDNERLMVG